MEHDGGGHHLLLRRFEGWRTGAVEYIRIPRRIDDALCEDCLPACLRFGDDAGYRVAIHDGGDEEAVHHRMNACLLDQRIGDQLEAFRVEFIGVRLAFGHRGTHGMRAGLELAADAVCLDSLFMAVPGKAFHAHCRDVAAQAAEALDKRNLGTGAGCGKGSRQARRAGTHHQHIGLADNFNFSRRLGYAAQTNGHRKASL